MRKRFLSLFLVFIFINMSFVFTSADEGIETDYAEALQMIETWLDAQQAYDRLPRESDYPSCPI